METLTLAVYDFRTDPKAVLEMLRHKIESALSETHSGVFCVQVSKGDCGERNPNA